METLDNIEMENPCVYCGRKNRKSIGWLSREKQFSCACGRITIVDTKQIDASIVESDSGEAVSALELKIRNLLRLPPV